MSSCPSDETLRMLANEVLDPALFSDVEEHIESCQACRARLEKLAWECRTPAVDSPHPLPVDGAPPEIPGFEIKDELGRGGMGVVYLARDVRVGRSVALKVMPAGLGADQRARNRWRKEGKAFSRIRHPNVVVLHDIGEVGCWSYLVLEYIPGLALNKRLDGPVPRREAAQLVARVAEAVHCIHRAGVLHLDLKPANILLDGEPGLPLDQVTPKVADFGIARLLVDAERGDETSLMAQGSWGGTPSYMAPEQVSGTRDQLCPATDIHALGAILYTLMTGRHAFEGASLIETMEQILHQEPVSPRRLNPKVPRDLETITLKCLGKTPSQRYASAEALAEDLRRWLDGRPILARPISRVEHIWRACRRRPGVAILGAVLAATVMVSFGWILGLYGHANAQWVRAEAQRVRAEAAREAAEKNRKSAERNLEIASTVIRDFQRLLLDSFTGERLLDGEKLDNTARLLRQQVVSSRTIQGFKPELLLPLSQIDGYITGRLYSAGRLDEARALTKERIDFLHECTARDPRNESYLFETVGTLYFGFLIERRAMRADEALDYLGRASSLVLGTDSVHPERQRFACKFCQDYLQLKNEYDRLADFKHSAMAVEGHRKLFTMVQNESSGRADLVLSKACLLADHGEWDRAHELVHTMLPPDQSAQSIQHFQNYLQQGLMEWFDREMPHRAGVVHTQSGGLEDLQRCSDHIVDHLARLYESFGINKERRPDVISATKYELATHATRHRREGNLEKADGLVSMFMAVAQIIIRRFPEDGAAFDFLSEAHLQRSKNAWKRDDLATVKRELTQSLEAINRVIVLEPNNTAFLKLATDRKERLAGLPKS